MKPLTKSVKNECIRRITENSDIDLSNLKPCKVSRNFTVGDNIDN